MTCPECNGKKEVDWHYLDGSVEMGRCPRCRGTGEEPEVMFPYGDKDKPPREVII
jgi:Zn-finger nucleic acid-binding protein